MKPFAAIQVAIFIWRSCYLQCVCVGGGGSADENHNSPPPACVGLLALLLERALTWMDMQRGLRRVKEAGGKGE